MEPKTITVDYTKKDLRRYGIFTNYQRTLWRKSLFFIFPLFGLLFLVTAISSTDTDTYLYFAGIFLILYPFILIGSSILRSNKTYNTNKLLRVPVEVTFNSDHFTTKSERSNSTTRYEDLYFVYNTKHAFYIFISKHQGLIVPKGNNEKAVMNAIGNLLHEEMPNKYKKVGR